MSEISESEIKSMTKEQNYMRGYEDGKSDMFDNIRTEIHGYLCEVGYTGWIDISKNKIEGDIFKIIEKYMG